MKTLKGHTNWVFMVEWSPEGTMLASAGAVRKKINNNNNKNPVQNPKLAIVFC